MKKQATGWAKIPAKHTFAKRLVNIKYKNLLPLNNMNKQHNFLMSNGLE